MVFSDKYAEEREGIENEDPVGLAIMAVCITLYMPFDLLHENLKRLTG